jgi:hypothetical protein
MENQIERDSLLLEKRQLREELIKVSNLLKTCQDKEERQELIQLRSDIKQDMDEIDAEILSLSENLNDEQLEHLENQQQEEEPIKTEQNEISEK